MRKTKKSQLGTPPAVESAPAPTVQAGSPGADLVIRLSGEQADILRMAARQSKKGLEMFATDAIMESAGKVNFPVPKIAEPPPVDATKVKAPLLPIVREAVADPTASFTEEGKRLHEQRTRHPCIHLDESHKDRDSFGACTKQFGKPCHFTAFSCKSCVLFTPKMIGRPGLSKKRGMR
jgi:hypothetical protein